MSLQTIHFCGNAHQCRPLQSVIFYMQSTMDVLSSSTTDTAPEPFTDGLRGRRVMVGMYQRVLLVLSSALLTLSGSWTEAQRQTSALQSGPFFVWSNQPYIAADSHGSASRAWYEVSNGRWQP